MESTRTSFAAAPDVRVLAAYDACAEDTIKKVADSGRITLAFRESSVPFSYDAGMGKPVGMAMENTNAVVAEVKRTVNKPVQEVNYVAVTSANRIPQQENKTNNHKNGTT